MSSQTLRRAAAALLAAALAVSTSPAAFADAPVPAPQPTKAKNVILVIIDGFGFFDSDAGSIYRHGATGELTYEKLPLHLAMSTYPAGSGYDGEKAWKDFDYVRYDATDSAAAATALACGVKTYCGAIGVGGDKNNPERVQNVVEAAESSGKATGVITTVELSHATPAGFVAHNASRNSYEEIAREMLFESAVDVIMGAGHPLYDNDGKSRTRPSFKYVGGRDAWLALQNGERAADSDGDSVPDPWTLIEERADFQKLAAGPAPKRLLGIPRVATTLREKRGGDEKAAPYVVASSDSIPTLAEMTAAALNVLDDDPDGFFLMIEGGAVDWASHENESGRLVEELLDLDDAVAAVIGWVENNSSWDETLIIVTADHECGYVTGPKSGPSAWEAKKGLVKDDAPPADAKPRWNSIENRGKGVLPGMEWHAGDHTNSLVPVYARGAGSALLDKYADETDPRRGRYLDNTEIAKTIMAVVK
jgi:alkaline phosphatase